MMTEENSQISIEHETPVYMHLLITFGTIIASGFFVGFIYSAKLFSSPPGSQEIIMGAIFIIASTIMLFLGRKAPLTNNVLYTICALSMMLSGQIIFITGTSPGTVWDVAFILIALALPAYIITGQKLLGFTAILSFFVILNISIYFDRYSAKLGSPGLQLMFILQILAIAIFLYYRELEKKYEPIFYALIVSLFVSTLYLVHVISFSTYYSKAAIDAMQVISITLSISLIALIIWAFGGFQKKYAEPMLLAIIGVIVLATRLDPGITLAISLMILGYKRHEKRISILGIILMPVAITLYYYSLHITLFEKSMHLLAGGGLLLAGCAYIKYRGWDRQEKTLSP